MGILYPLSVQLASQLKHFVLRLIKLKKTKKKGTKFMSSTPKGSKTSKQLLGRRLW